MTNKYYQKKTERLRKIAWERYQYCLKKKKQMLKKGTRMISKFY